MTRKPATPETAEPPKAWDKVIAWVEDRTVSIDATPCIAWCDDVGVWWAGLPQSYINLIDQRWTIIRWEPLRSRP